MVSAVGVLAIVGDAVAAGASVATGDSVAGMSVGSTVGALVPGADVAAEPQAVKRRAMIKIAPNNVECFIFLLTPFSLSTNNYKSTPNLLQWGLLCLSDG